MDTMKSGRARGTSACDTTCRVWFTSHAAGMVWPMKRLRTVGQRLRRGLRTLVRWLAKMLQWLFKMLRWLFSSLPGMIAVWLVIGLIVPIVVLVCLDQPDVLAWLGLDGTEVEEEEPELQGIGRWERVLIAGGVVTLSAAIIGLVVSYRKQRDA